MRFARLFISALLCLSLLASLQARAADSAACSGLVVDENNVPVAAAQLKLEDGAGHLFRTQTDTGGRFVLKNLLAGDYKL